MSEMKVESNVFELSISSSTSSHEELQYPLITNMDNHPKTPTVRAIAQSEDFIRPQSLASIASQTDPATEEQLTMLK